MLKLPGWALCGDLAVPALERLLQGCPLLQVELSSARLLLGEDGVWSWRGPQLSSGIREGWSDACAGFRSSALWTWH